jgi:hypothetical protein
MYNKKREGAILPFSFDCSSRVLFDYVGHSGFSFCYDCVIPGASEESDYSAIYHIPETPEDRGYAARKDCNASGC